MVPSFPNRFEIALKLFYTILNFINVLRKRLKRIHKNTQTKVIKMIAENRKCSNLTSEYFKGGKAFMKLLK